MEGMTFKEHVSLASHTTFMVNVSARYFAEVRSVSDIRDLVTNPLWQSERHYILGGGSNLLIRADLDGIVVKNLIDGIDVVDEDDTSISLRVGAGVVWDDLVKWTTERDLWGIENLVLIPGSVGGAVVQNIGAYGVEVSSVVATVEAVDLSSGKELSFTNEACQFSYRSSVFKSSILQYLVSYVTLRLSKSAHPVLTYPRVLEDLQARGSAEHPSPKDLAEVIANIRRSKLPEVGEIGMAGSFFKNPVVTREQADELKVRYPDMPRFDLPDGSVKIPAGWVIETLGYKGYRDGNVGTYDKHALVLVNHGGASGHEVWNLAEKIMNDARESLGMNLEPEVVLLP